MSNAEEQREGNEKRLGGVTGKGFLPGQSGNPGGMRKGTRSITARLRDLLDATELGGKPLPGGKQVADLVSEVILKAALKGDHKFVSTLLDRTEGKVQEPEPDPDDVKNMSREELERIAKGEGGRRT